MLGKKKQAPGANAAPGVGGAAGRYENPAGLGNVFGRKSDGDGVDEDEGDDGDKNIPPEILPYLFDMAYFDEKLKAGMKIDVKGMDPVDTFFANVFQVNI